MPDFRKMISRRALFGMFARAVTITSGLGFLARTASVNAGVPDDPSRPGQAQEVLAGMIRQLFPHQGLGSDYYLEAARSLADRAAAAGGAEQLHDGIAKLDSLCGRAGWAGAEDSARVAVLKKLEAEPFFQFVRRTAIELIYRDPSVWDLIGYGGNALKRGGYLHQGFNDIHWLPPAGKS